MAAKANATIKLIIKVALESSALDSIKQTPIFVQKMRSFASELMTTIVLLITANKYLKHSVSW
jgi:hypothetical protein